MSGCWRAKQPEITNVLWFKNKQTNESCNLSGRTPLLCAHTSHLCRLTDPAANCSERVWLELPAAGNVALGGSDVAGHSYENTIIFVTGLLTHVGVNTELELKHEGIEKFSRVKTQDKTDAVS